jgi:hypothetical protein
LNTVGDVANSLEPGSDAQGERVKSRKRLLCKGLYHRCLRHPFFLKLLSLLGLRQLMRLPCSDAWPTDVPGMAMFFFLSDTPA